VGEEVRGQQGLVLLGKKSETEEANYLFLLDRIYPEKINLPFIARQWQLSRGNKT